MKVLALTRYGPLGASSRVRFHQYFPFLRDAGIKVQVSSFLRNEYVLGLNRGRKHIIEAALGYARRIYGLLRVRDVNLIWLEKEVLPWLPEVFERAILPSRIPYVLDYDDAVFHYYDLHKSAWVRDLLGRKHDRIMRGAALIMAGNEYIAARGREAGARRIEIVPTVVDVGRYAAQAGSAPVESGAVKIGWIGQRFNAHYLRILEEPICRLSESGLARFIAVGCGNVLDDLPIESVPWSEETEVKCLAEFDIGLMPVPDEPFERGKCGYKLIQYMASRKPVIASPVGVNRNIVEHGTNGFLADTAAEWDASIEKLARSSAMRHAFGARGFEKVERMYSLKVWAPRVAELLREASRG